MAEPADLVCREVIMEDQIEPHVAVVDTLSHSKYDSHHQSHHYLNKRKSSHFYQASPEQMNDEHSDSEATKSGPKKRKDSSGYSSRRKVRSRRNVVCRLDFNDDFLYVDDENACKQEPPEVYEDPMHAFLPIEIRWHILKRLRIPELLPLRVISKSWRNTIDALFKVDVKIEGDIKEFRGKCGLSMKSCQLVSLQNPGQRYLFQSVEPEEVKIFRGICSLNFEEMASQWIFLSKLELCWRTTMKNLLFGKRIGENSVSVKTFFPNLNDFKLEILVNDNLGKMTQFRILSNVTNLLSFEYPRLETFSTVFVGYRELHTQNKILPVVVLPFMCRHARSLCTIEFTLKYTSHVIYPPVHPRHILFCVPANIKSNYKAPQTSSEGHLVTTQLRKASSAPEHCVEWINMLQNTRKLEVAIMTRFLSWSIRHLDFFGPAIRGYSKFLRRLDIINVTMYNGGSHNTATQLDAKIFRDCTQLTQLRLFRAPIIFNEDEIDPPTELINLNQLPTTLEEIVIDGLPVSSEEILTMIKEFDKLQSFHYFQSQVPRRNMLWNNGINWDILKSIIKHRRLVNVKVHISSAGQTISHTQYEEPLMRLALKYGWSTTGISPGYLNMFQITLTKPYEIGV